MKGNFDEFQVGELQGRAESYSAGCNWPHCCCLRVDGRTIWRSLSVPNKVPPLPWWPIMAVFAGLFAAAWILVIGYINADAGRRGMGRVLWTLIAIFVPNCLGILLYFLLRKPFLRKCAGCGAMVDPSFQFCQRCGCVMSPTCTNCGRGVSHEFICCPYCGKPVKTEAATTPNVPSGG